MRQLKHSKIRQCSRMFPLNDGGQHDGGRKPSNGNARGKPATIRRLLCDLPTHGQQGSPPELELKHTVNG